MLITCIQDCGDCIYLNPVAFNDKDEVTKIKCSARNKQYYYGQKIDCDDKKEEE